MDDKTPCDRQDAPSGTIDPRLGRKEYIITSDEWSTLPYLPEPLFLAHEQEILSVEVWNATQNCVYLRAGGAGIGAGRADTLYIPPWYHRIMLIRAEYLRVAVDKYPHGEQGGKNNNQQLQIILFSHEQPSFSAVIGNSVTAPYL
jgi:hypothetical protein